MREVREQTINLLAECFAWVLSLVTGKGIAPMKTSALVSLTIFSECCGLVAFLSQNNTLKL